MNSIVFGETGNQLPIPAYCFGDSGPRVLILGGVHGDEVEGVVCAYGLLNAFRKDFDLKLQLTLVPTFNLDGVLAKTRVNARGVDLNRNLPTRDWDPKAFNDRYPPGPKAGSEPENQALVQWIEKNPPALVISLHSFTRFLLNVNGNCEPEAGIIHQKTQYPIEESMGYPTPGCLGTYTGLEQNMPTITYELERGMPSDQILTTHVPAIIAALKETQHARSH